LIYKIAGFKKNAKNKQMEFFCDNAAEQMNKGAE
jgi:hypothetical protein